MQHIVGPYSYTKSRNSAAELRRRVKESATIPALNSRTLSSSNRGGGYFMSAAETGFHAKMKKYDQTLNV